jgi:hypothetical protein
MHARDTDALRLADDRRGQASIGRQRKGDVDALEATGRIVDCRLSLQRPSAIVLRVAAVAGLSLN